MIRKNFLTAEEERQLFGWSSDPFGSGPVQLVWLPKEEHLLIVDDGQPVSHAGIVRREVTVGGAAVAVGGLGGVITIPEFQRRGFAERLISEAVRLIGEEWRLPYAMLFCYSRRLAFYQRQGWKELNDPVFIQQPTGELQMPTITMVRELSGQPWPSGPVHTASLPW